MTRLIVGNLSVCKSIREHRFVTHVFVRFIFNIQHCRSVKSKVSELCCLNQGTDPSIVVGTELWLDDSVKDWEILPRGNTVYRHDRRSHGGGMSLFIADEFHSTQFQIQDSVVESVWSRIYLRKRENNFSWCLL